MSYRNDFHCKVPDLTVLKGWSVETSTDPDSVTTRYPPKTKREIWVQLNFAVSSPCPVAIMPILLSLDVLRSSNLRCDGNNCTNALPATAPPLQALPPLDTF